MKLTQKALSATRRVVIFGPPKAGKTELVSKLAEKYKLIWFDLESGYTTLLKLPREWQERIEIICIPDSKDFPMAVETLLKVFKGTPVDICEEHGKVACALCKKDGKPHTRVCLNEVGLDTVVVVDSLTQFSLSAMSHITKGQPDTYKPERDDWGNLKILVEKLMSLAQSAKYNLACITHEEEVEMEDGKNKLVPVCGSSKSSRNTAKYFDDVVYCEVKNKKHVAGSSTGYSNNILTGSRTDVELEKDAAPSLLSIFTSWKQVAASADVVKENANETGNDNGNIRSGINTGSSVDSASSNKEIAGSGEASPTDSDSGEIAVSEISKSPGQIALERLKQKHLGGK